MKKNIIYIGVGNHKAKNVGFLKRFFIPFIDFTDACNLVTQAIEMKNAGNDIEQFCIDNDLEYQIKEIDDEHHSCNTCMNYSPKINTK